MGSREKRADCAFINTQKDALLNVCLQW